MNWGMNWRMKTGVKTVQTIGYTIMALTAFAANSVLCRLALKDHTIDPASFTAVRLFSGVFMFVILFSFKALPANRGLGKKSTPWAAALLLFGYAISFSFAYVSLSTGTGALLLFGAVQLTMIAISICSGNKLQGYEWAGVFISFVGLAYLVAPAITTPSFTGFLLMTLAGIAWGLYTVLGRGSTNPLQDTAVNFFYSLPLVVLLLLISWPSLSLSWSGVILAVMSGALASALGYSLWYLALGSLSTVEAAVVQLSVPVIAAIGGVLFVGEAISMRLVVACLLVVGGILMVLRSSFNQAATNN